MEQFVVEESGTSEMEFCWLEQESWLLFALIKEKLWDQAFCLLRVEELLPIDQKREVIEVVSTNRNADYIEKHWFMDIVLSN